MVLPAIDPTQMDGIARFTPDPPTEKVSEGDRRLVMRLEARIAALQAAAQEIQQIITQHLAAEYNLQQGDSISDDGTIIRTVVGAS